MSNSRESGPDGETISEDLNTAEKLILLLIEAEGGRAVPGNLWLQKESFLLSKRLPLDELLHYLDFQPYFQGPFSESVNNISEDLEYLGLVTRDRRGIRATEMGHQVANQVRDGTDESLIELIEDVKSKLNDLSKDELLVYIYYNFPDFTTKSLEKEDLDRKRKSVAVKLFERGKVNTEEAAKLAGVSESNLEDELAETA